MLRDVELDIQIGKEEEIKDAANYIEQQRRREASKDSILALFNELNLEESELVNYLDSTGEVPAAVREKTAEKTAESGKASEAAAMTEMERRGMWR